MEFLYLLQYENHLGSDNKGIVVDKGRPDCEGFWTLNLTSETVL